MSKILELRNGFAAQLNECKAGIDNLNRQLTSEKERFEQLKGAIYALDVANQQLEEEKKAAAAETSKENGESNGQAANS